MEQLIEMHSVNTVKPRSGTKDSRLLLMAAIVFVVMLLHRRLVLHHFPILDAWLIEPLVAVVVSAAAFWVATRGKSSR